MDSNSRVSIRHCVHEVIKLNGIPRPLNSEFKVELVNNERVRICDGEVNIQDPFIVP